MDKNFTSDSIEFIKEMSYDDYTKSAIVTYKDNTTKTFKIAKSTYKNCIKELNDENLKEHQKEYKEKIEAYYKRFGIVTKQNLLEH